MINVSKLKNFDEFALASVTTDTRIHSPANTHTDEESEEELYLDMYKVTRNFLTFLRAISSQIESVDSW